MNHFTNEQLDIIYSEEERLFVSAGPGSGKTTVLKEYSKIRKYSKFLYIVYNVSMKESSENSFPPNTEIKTSYGLAYQLIGKQYKNQIGNININSIFKTLSYFKNKDISDSREIKKAYNVKKFFEQYCISTEDINNFILPSEWYREQLIEYLQEIKNGKAIVTHEFIMKQLYLSNIQLNYDYILIDEAQDSNRLFFEFINKQNANVIFVGDPDQKLYSYRGAYNIFENKNNSIHKDLSMSFRFGKSIAAYANEILKLKGSNREIIGNPNIESKLVENIYQPYTIISRSNFILFENLVRNINNNVYINGSSEIFSILFDIQHLYNKDFDLIKNDFLRLFKNYKEFKSMVENIDIIDFKSNIKIWEKYGEYSIQILSDLQEYKKNYDVMLTTSHKSKGLEFLNVELSNDYFTETEDELNILYVGATRAIDNLKIFKF